jgi:hypothetical protein
MAIESFVEAGDASPGDFDVTWFASIFVGELEKGE